jgi:hypothetical protein
MSWLHTCCCTLSEVTHAGRRARATEVDHRGRPPDAAVAASAAAGRRPSTAEISEAAGWGCSAESVAAPRTAAAKAPEV